MTPAPQTSRKKPGAPTPLTGSQFSDRQIRRAVERERMISVLLVNDDEIDGWIYGADSYHWGVVSKTGETHLVHKSAPALAFHPTMVIGSLTPEEQATVRGLTDPYRNFFRAQN